ncbi:MAG: hypothetical protein HKO79_12465, partial [Desulfobacterales bacterium]|nr:hypothetical protein [Desulfobacterales bacterium]
QSIIKEEAKSDEMKLIEKWKTKFPKMSQKVAEACGVLNPNTDLEAETFLDEFEHQVTTYEMKNKKTYSE